MAARSSLAGTSGTSLPRPVVVGLSALVVLGVTALVVLIILELSPRHATVRHASHAVEVAPETEAPAPAPVAAPTVAPRVAPAVATAAAVAPPAAAPSQGDGLTRVRALASIIHDPDSHPSEGVFHNSVTGWDHYSYEGFGPYRRGDLKRDSKNPDAWQIDGSDGPRHPTGVDDLAPPGALKSAATVRDDKGNITATWYSIEAGPLAPAYATVLATGGTRVVSRAYLEENPSEFPASLTEGLDR